ncbi:MAG: TonB-dependent receptor [Muribaculaceae bacterium]|nr:TonB-dependent receptor [Muribaculaceae bacterium]
MKNVCFHMNRKFWVTMAMLLAFTLPALAQRINVHGHVVDETGEELIGATVMEKGTTNGAATDIDGNFDLSVQPTATLVVSYVGYDPMEVAVNGQTNLHIVMKANSTTLNETVVIGYGTVKKSDATGSVALVTPDDISEGISTSAQDLLTGASPGVVVTSGGGSPEGGATIRIRGGSSLSATNDPLIVLDGVPLANDGVQGMANPLAMISPDNIESMTILKDASATAIYGSRASNGVIIITTKKGKSGRPQVNFSANVSVNTARRTWDVLSAGEFTELIRNNFAEGHDIYKELGTADTDWQKEVLRTSVSHDYALSVGGTVGFLPYRISGTYTMNNGILKDSQMQRVTAGINLNPKFFDGLLQINANVKGYYVRNRFSDEGAVGAAVAFNPTVPVMSNWASGNADFPYFYNGYTSVTTDQFHSWNINGTVNPLAVIKSRDDVANVYRSNGNLQIDYAFHFLPDLHANLNLGYDVSKSNEHIYMHQNSPRAWNENIKNGAGTHYQVRELRRNTLLDFYLNYKKEVESIYSNFDIMAGYSWQRFDAHGWNNGTVYTSQGFYGPSTTNGILTIDPDSKAPGEHISPEYRWNSGNLMLVSFFGRLNYTFKDTYLLTFTLRDDGTSRFSKDNRWGLFPALALGWKIINMPFMESARDNMNEFKLRLGWGITGQQSVGGYFPYMPVYNQSTQGSYYPNMYTGTYLDSDGNVISKTLYPGVYNPNLKWEETTTWNVGVDMGWWNNRLNVALDWYLRNSKDLLSYVTVAPGAATSNMMDQNIGTLRNIGVEATISGKPVMTDDFTWTSSLNIAWNQNKITKLNNTDDPNSYIATGGISGGTGNNVQAHKVDYPAYTFHLYEQVYDEYGMPIEGCYVDQNGDGTIDDNDRVFKHSKDPKVTMSWNNTFSYKNWDLGFQLRASIGNYVYNDVASTHSTLSDIYNTSGVHNLIDTDYYFQGGQTTNTYYSDYWLSNAGFVRCDNITLGYTWPDLLDNALRLRLYGAVQNPFVISKYKGLDPEVFGGIDNNVYPRPITFTLGVVATF